ncbi:MAG: flavodoxin domain-containing protein [Acidimicrobiia bacterium]
MMRVLVAYASRHGATAGIADRLANRLRDRGMDSVALEVTAVRDVEEYDAFVVGSAAYMFHWLKEASAFVKRNRSVLADRPVWLFSSGPLGTEMVDKEGNDVLEESRPKEFAELELLIHPRDTRVFFGAWDPDVPAKGMAERLFRKMPVSREVLPVGDFRDWDVIDAWADEIATALESSVAGPALTEI